MPTHPVGSLGRLTRPNSWPVLRVACAALPSRTNPATAIRVASVFTREATPATAKPHLSNRKNTGRLVIAHRPTTARSFAVGKQETVVQGASGACALSPRPEGRGTSRPLIVLNDSSCCGPGENRGPGCCAAPRSTERPDASAPSELMVSRVRDAPIWGYRPICQNRPEPDGYHAPQGAYWQLRSTRSDREWAKVESSPA